ncbi:TRAP-type mannitol/chloroaromatic compound transport system permease small subunit [Arthrobacter sp. SORGH_AS 212]|nr:TRAP-type mannitol/chloroaromatic compound transport system permease small subunit [Arthrobacter sp. SORGH_AS_0212]
MTEVWAWVVGIVVVLLFLLPWSLLWVGRCVDYVPGYGESFCEFGPVIGFPAATVIAVLSLLLILYCLYRIVRILIQRRRYLPAKRE